MGRESDKLNESFEQHCRENGEDYYTRLSERRIAEAYATWKVGFYKWQLTRDRTMRIDSFTQRPVELPPLPHADYCRCAKCKP